MVKMIPHQIIRSSSETEKFANAIGISLLAPENMVEIACEKALVIPRGMIDIPIVKYRIERGLFDFESAANSNTCQSMRGRRIFWRNRRMATRLSKLTSTACEKLSLN